MSLAQEVEVFEAAVIAQTTIDMNFAIGGVISLIAGILILLIPRLLNYIVAAYLIVIGLVQILGL